MMRARFHSFAARFSAAVALACVSAVAAAQSPPVAQDPRDMGEAARKVYAQTLHDVRDLLDRKQYAEAIAKLDKLTRRAAARTPGAIHERACARPTRARPTTRWPYFRR